MSMQARLGAAAVISVLAIGGGVLLLNRAPQSNVGSPSPSPQLTAAPTATEVSGVTVAAFKSARDAICSQGVADRAPLKVRFIKLFDSSGSDAERADGLVALDAFITLDASVIDRLAALEPPADLHDGHIANITQFRDELTLVRRISSLTHAGDPVSAKAVDASTDDLTREIQAWEGQYSFNNCP